MLFPSLLALALTALPLAVATDTTACKATSTTTTKLLHVGAFCNTTAKPPYALNSNLCADGAACFAKLDYALPVCGGEGAACTKSEQCSTRYCQNGQCAGALKQILGSNCNTTEFPGPDGYRGNSSVCAAGAKCYGVSGQTVPRCGGFQAECEDSSQCATNACLNGLCGGKEKVALGKNCAENPYPPFTVLDNVCANGADCYGVTAYTIPQCGKFQASCTESSQCATNECNLDTGLCGGPEKVGSKRMKREVKREVKRGVKAAGVGNVKRGGVMRG